MKKLAVLILFGVSAPLISGAQIKGKVILVSDGDTFTLLTPDKQRLQIGLFGVDAPELGQDFSEEAKNYLGDLLFFDTVNVAVKGIDASGKTLGIVSIFKINVNERMLQQGLAWHNIKFDNNPTWTEYENRARQLKKGLWSKPNPVSPWQWRTDHKQ